MITMIVVVAVKMMENQSSLSSVVMTVDSREGYSGTYPNL